MAANIKHFVATTTSKSICYTLKTHKTHAFQFFLAKNSKNLKKGLCIFQSFLIIAKNKTRNQCS